MDADNGDSRLVIVPRIIKRNSRENIDAEIDALKTNAELARYTYVPIKPNAQKEMHLVLDLEYFGKTVRMQVKYNQQFFTVTQIQKNEETKKMVDVIACFGFNKNDDGSCTLYCLPKHEDMLHKIAEHIGNGVVSN
jgi:hypothetical protein